MSTRRALGILADFISNTDEALEHFGRRYQYCKKGGFLPELAWTCRDWANMLMRRGSAEDRSKAKAYSKKGLLCLKN